MPKLNLAGIEQRAADIRTRNENKGNNEFRWFQTQQGPNQVRIMEPLFEDGRLAFIAYRHYNADNHFCVARTWPEKRVDCPICKVIEEVQKLNPESPIDEYWARSRAWVNAIDRKHPELGVQIMQIPISAYNDLVTQISTRDAVDPTKYVYGDITDLQTGRDIILSKSGEKQATEYTISVHPVAGPLSTDMAQVQQWLDTRYKLDKVFSYPDDATWQQILGWAAKLRSEFLAPSAQPTIHNAPAQQSVQQPLAPAGMPACYGLDWRPNPHKPAKCEICPVEMTCKKVIEEKISKGIALPTEQTPIDGKK